jgi:2-polyprenyl-3-methyl-5-hydroxy-6-metoxy-1,4-benzoquinol methylase
MTDRFTHEVQHGKFLREHGAEDVWGWGSPAGQVRARRRVRKLIEQSGMTAETNALEIGCGTGLFTSWLAETGARIDAMDLSADLIDIARSRGMDPARVRCECKPFEAYEGEGLYDAVLGSSVLHHLELAPALQRIHRLLKPGGVMAFAEPNLLNPQIALIKKWKWLGRKLGDSEDETAFVRWTLAKDLRQAGFVGVDVQPIEWLHPAVPKALIPLVQGLGRVLEILPGLREFGGSLTIVARKPSLPNT